MSPRPLRAVVFDLDDTLADLSGAERLAWASVSRVIEELVPEVDIAAFRARYVEVADGHYERFVAGEIDFRGYRYERLEDALAPWRPLDDDLFLAYSVEKRRIIEELWPVIDAAPTLDLLRARGLRIGVLTNGPSAMQRRKLEVIGLAGHVDAVAISEEIGVGKPDPAAYAHALAALGVEAPETAMVGDSLVNDVEGALAAGLGGAVWVTRRETAAPPGAAKVARLGQVPAALGLV
ncbi:MAG: HAD family hydrolase [Thermoleophilia bacterium]